MFSKKIYSTLELDTISSQDFKNYIPEIRGEFRTQLLARKLPAGGIEICSEENGMIEITTNSGYSLFKNLYMRQIKEKMTKDILFYIIQNCDTSPEEKKQERGIVQAYHNKLSTSESKIRFFSIQVKYAWLFPENAGITVEQRDKCITVAEGIHEMFIKYLLNVFDYYYPASSICYSTMEELQDGFDEFKDEESFFTGIEADNDHPDFDDGLYPPYIELNPQAATQLLACFPDEYAVYTYLTNYIPKTAAEKDVCCKIITTISGTKDIIIPGFGTIRNIHTDSPHIERETKQIASSVSHYRPVSEEESDEVKICRRDLEKKWMNFSSEEDTNFSPEDELHFDDDGEIVNIYTANESRRLREKPWCDESNKYYYMKTPDGQNFKGSPYLLEQLWREHIKTKAIRRTKAKKNTPKKKYNKKMEPKAPKKKWKEITHKSREDLSPIHFPSLI